VSLLAVNASSLARLATNVSLLGFTELAELREPFDAVSQQGSSAMPHKRNTELSERVRGLSRRVKSAAIEELDSAVLWLERDISHSSTERFTFPDAFGALAYMARLCVKILDGLEVDAEAMTANLRRTQGAIYGSRLLNALLATDAISRTEAYDLVKGLAQRAMDKGVELRELVLADPEIRDLLAPEVIEEAFDPSFYLARITEVFRRLGI
jgi:adenylosuccinate lyase